MEYERRVAERPSMVSGVALFISLLSQTRHPRPVRETANDKSKSIHRLEYVHDLTRTAWAKSVLPLHSLILSHLMLSRTILFVISNILIPGLGSIQVWQ